MVTRGEKEQLILKLQTHSELKYFSDNSSLLVGRWLEYKRMWFRFLHQHKHFSIYMYKFCRFLPAWKYNSTFILQKWGVFCTIHIVQWSQHPSDIPDWNKIEIRKTETTVCFPFPEALYWLLQIQAFLKEKKSHVKVIQGQHFDFCHLIYFTKFFSFFSLECKYYFWKFANTNDPFSYLIYILPFLECILLWYNN